MSLKSLVILILITVCPIDVNCIFFFWTMKGQDINCFMSYMKRQELLFK